LLRTPDMVHVVSLALRNMARAVCKRYQASLTIYPVLRCLAKIKCYFLTKLELLFLRREQVAWRASLLI